MRTTLSNFQYGTSYIANFVAIKQTLRLRLFAGLVDKQFFPIILNLLTRKVSLLHKDRSTAVLYLWVRKIMDMKLLAFDEGNLFDNSDLKEV